jgi:hypothetical protein
MKAASAAHWRKHAVKTLIYLRVGEGTLCFRSCCRFVFTGSFGAPNNVPKNFRDRSRILLTRLHSIPTIAP